MIVVADIMPFAGTVGGGFFRRQIKEGKRVSKAFLNNVMVIDITRMFADMSDSMDKDNLR